MEESNGLEPAEVENTVEAVTSKPAVYLSSNSCDALRGFSDSKSSNSNDSADSLAPEIWDAESDVDDAESEPSETASQNIRNIHYVLSYFLLFFQLCYHVSDRGLQHIINLLSSVLHVHLLSSIVSGNNIIAQLSSGFPKTIYSLRKKPLE